MKRFKLLPLLFLLVSLLNACERDDPQPRVHVRRYLGEFEFNVHAFGGYYQGSSWDSTKTFRGKIERMSSQQVSIPYEEEGRSVEPMLDEAGVLTDSTTFGYAGWFGGSFIGYDSVHFRLSLHAGAASNLLWEVSGHRID